MRGLIYVALLIISIQALANNSFSLYGQVVYVDDGDTIIINAEHAGKTIIRLADIDAPEIEHSKQRLPGQPYGEESKAHLHAMANGQRISANCYGYDQNQRTLCDVYLNGENLGHKQVEAGLAWAYMNGGGRYLRDKTLLLAEKMAAFRRVGLWSLSAQIQPWVWRKNCWKYTRCD